MIDYLKTIDTPTLSNAIELLNIRPRSEGFTPLQVKCIFPDFGRMVGYAVTAQVETVTRLETADIHRFVELYEALEASPKPGVIAFQEVGAMGDYAAHCGEVMATCFTRLGAIGLVSDCGVRDIPEVRAMGFHYFARGSVASHAYFRIVRVGVAVHVAGMVVQPGDILHGDENGLLVVPKAEEHRVAEMVDKVRSREKALMEYVKGPDFTLAGLREKMVE